MTMILKNFEKKENNTAAFTVASDPAEFEKAVNAAYLKSRKNINIPGFRKGKAPRQVIEGMYGRDVFYQDAMDEVAPEAYAFAVKEKELRVVGQPRITDVNVTDDRAVEFTFDVSLYPEVTLGEYKGVKAVKLTQTVTDDEVDAEIAATQKRNARMLNVDRPAEMGDTVNINFEGFLNGEPFEGGKGENHPLELGSNSFVPGFEEQLVGMKAGEEKDIDITFPKEYTPELAGKAVVFHVVINEVSSPEYPELDDEFAQDVSEFDTFEEYKADVRATLQKRMDDSTESAFKDAVVQKACDAMTVEIPDVMVEEKVDEFLRNYASQFGMYERDMTRAELLKLFGMNEDTVKFSIRPAAESQVKTELLLEAVAKAEGLEPTEEELEAYAKKMADGIGAKVEDVKRYFGDEYIRAELLKEQAMDLIVASAVPTDAADMPSEEVEKELKEEFAAEVAEEAVKEAVGAAEENA